MESAKEWFTGHEITLDDLTPELKQELGDVLESMESYVAHLKEGEVL